VPHPENLIFDLDGTLVDSAPGICTSARSALRILGYADRDDTIIRPMIGLPLTQIARTLIGPTVSEGGIAEWCDCYRAEFDRIALPATAAFPGVADGLRRWQRQGRRLAVATSKRTDVAERVLAQAGIRETFAIVVGGDQVARGKPHPDMALHTLVRLGVPAELCAMIGDTTHDITMAQGALIPAYAVTYGAHDRETLSAARPHGIVDDFPALAGLLG
jgi:phosphoglycolate phosphatase